MEIISIKIGKGLFKAALFNKMPLEEPDFEELISILVEKSEKAKFLLYRVELLSRAERILIVAIENPTNEVDPWVYDVIENWVQGKLNLVVPGDWKVKLTIPNICFHKKLGIYFFFLSVINMAEAVAIDGFHHEIDEDGTKTMLIGPN